MEKCPSDDVLKKSINGATYVELEDAKIMQHEIGHDNSIKITLDYDGSE